MSSTSNQQAADLSAKLNKLKEGGQERDLMTKAQQLGLTYVNLDGVNLDTEALRLISKDEALSLEAVCYYLASDGFKLAAVNPELPALMIKKTEIEKQTGKQGSISVMTAKSLGGALESYSKIPQLTHRTEVVVTEADLRKVANLLKEDVSLSDLIYRLNSTDLVNLVMSLGLDRNASDIHLETAEDKVILRLRVDGVLHVFAEMEAKQHLAFVKRIKILSKVKLNITDQPQDGRFSIQLDDNNSLDVRVSLLPTVFGESVVLRLLRSNQILLTLDDLAVRPEMLTKLKTEIARPNGMILVTGPTGSGKTTTLYAVLQALNQESNKIITLEDPVEYKLAGVNHSQIDRSQGYTFAKALRSVLRQDPDIVMVGEIRDLETAEIAINASLTGHLLLSTLHTNNAVGVLSRFVAMGLKPFLFAPALNLILAQRLLRRLVVEHRQEVVLTDSQQQEVTAIWESLPEPWKTKVDLTKVQFYEPKEGVLEVDAYQGRMGIHEVLVLNDELRALIKQDSVDVVGVEQLAAKQGMLTLRQDGFLKVVEGQTSLSELFRVA